MADSRVHEDEVSTVIPSARWDQVLAKLFAAAQEEMDAPGAARDADAVRASAIPADAYTPDERALRKLLHRLGDTPIVLRCGWRGIEVRANAVEVVPGWVVAARSEHGEPALELLPSERVTITIRREGDEPDG